MEEQVDYLIIGSGFGGAVSAMRLAEKGYSVLVLEAGRRWRNRDFPRTNFDVGNYLWAPALGCYGIMRMSMPGNFLAMAGAGVGGGSLVYGAVLMEPPDTFYQDPQWRALDPDWRSTLEPHFKTAKRMLGVTRTPKCWAADEWLRRYAEAIGRGETFASTDVGIFFADEPGKTFPDPYFGGEGPPRTSCDYSGGCISNGCRTGAKNSLDKNYLYFAEKRGARIEPEVKVDVIRPDGQGAYIVEGYRATSPRPRHRRQWRAKNVVVAAGSLGTLELLLKCKKEGHLPHLSDQLGKRFRTNCEILCGVESRDPNAGFSEGSSIASIMYPNEHTSIECVRTKAGSDAMTILGNLMTDGGSWLTRPLKFQLNALAHPGDFLHCLVPVGRAKKTFYLLVMQSLDTYYDIVYRRSRTMPWRFTLQARATGASVPAYIPEANECARWIADQIDGIPTSAVTEVLLQAPITGHVLGGCHMASSHREGVIDKFGRVFGHEGLSVVDGSIMPGNPGINPTLTISALAEHVMSAVPPRAG